MYDIHQWIIEALMNREGISAEEAAEMKKYTKAQNCNQCGTCCKIARCGLADILFGPAVSNCPALKCKDNVYTCSIVEQYIGTEYEDTIRLILSVGCGCGRKRILL